MKKEQQRLREMMEEGLQGGVEFFSFENLLKILLRKIDHYWPFLGPRKLGLDDDGNKAEKSRGGRYTKALFMLVVLAELPLEGFFFFMRFLVFFSRCF